MHAPPAQIDISSPTTTCATHLIHRALTNPSVAQTTLQQPPRSRLSTVLTKPGTPSCDDPSACIVPNQYNIDQLCSPPNTFNRHIPLLHSSTVSSHPGTSHRTLPTTLGPAMIQASITIVSRSHNLTTERTRILERPICYISVLCICI